MSTPEAHPPTHELAELPEDTLPDARARELRAHVGQCLACQATLHEVSQVTVALRALPAELPVPEFVAARISHALAAERSSGGSGADGGSTAAGAPAGGDAGGTIAWFRRRLPQALAAAASVAVVGLGGYVALTGGGGSDSGGDTAAGAADSGVIESQGGEAAPAAPSGSGRNGSAQSGAAEEQNDELSTLDGGAGEFTTPTRSAIDARELSAEVQGVVRENSSASTGCGQVLSDELGMPLVGSAAVGAGILVVLDGGDSWDGWLLSTCNSLSTEELEQHVEVPKAG